LPLKKMYIMGMEKKLFKWEFWQVAIFFFVLLPLWFWILDRILELHAPLGSALRLILVIAWWIPVLLVLSFPLIINRRHNKG
jgi:hypothetical protein